MVQVGAEPGKRTPTEGSSWMWGLPLIIGRSQSIWTPTLIECSGESISDFMGGYLKVTRVAIILYLRPREGENSVTWVPHVGLTTGGITELIMPNYFSKSNKTWGLTTDFSGGFNLVQIFQIVSIYPWSNLAQDNYNILQPCFWANYKRAIPKSDINPWWGPFPEASWWDLPGPFPTEHSHPLKVYPLRGILAAQVNETDHAAACPTVLPLSDQC